MRVALVLAGLAGTVAGCHQDNQDLKKELAGIRQELAALRGQRGAPAARPPAPRGPDPAKVYAVGVQGEPAVGPADAPVTIVMAYEYACPWCNKEREILPALREAYGDDVRFVYRPYVVHPDLAGDAALAACAAHQQGKFHEVSDALWSDVFGKRAFDRASVERVATSVPGVDAARLRADMDGACKGSVERERDQLISLGVEATPQVWVNGRPMTPGFKPLANLKPIIDEELARAKERIAAGTPRAAYYDEWIVKKGLPKFEAGS